MIFFTADTHFNHENICQLSNRPFDSLHDMEETIVSRWNSKVGKGDLVYHLGDFALSWGKKDLDKIESMLSRLNGSKFLVKGNHDRVEVTKSKKWTKVAGLHEIKVKALDNQRIVLCHYPMRTWNQMARGAWMLHGHCHGNLPDTGGKILDVGVDCHKFKPVSLDEVAEYMGQRSVINDHRSGR